MQERLVPSVGVDSPVKGAHLGADRCKEIVEMRTQVRQAHQPSLEIGYSRGHWLHVYAIYIRA
ncbi:hypothetical protein [Bosea beijingensis]|uniref:hypothetical protein n=1 Tax=Bosea beijingensis TaxID=3068632 RepID=UPI0027413773|nr:hypothetical protein [Bosea sp. REN20]